MEITHQDDYFHLPTNDERWWSETYWFSFDDPASGLSGTFYPLLRPNLNIAALTVALWAPEQSTAWTAPYYRSYWHLSLPEFSGTEMTLEGLSYEILEPLQRYRITYRDGKVLEADLTVTGIADNFVVLAAPERGHWDQPTRVRGHLRLHDRELTLDCFGMRDRSWGPRRDDATARASYVYGICADASFLVVTQHGESGDLSMGYQEVDGARSPLTSATLDVERDELSRVAAVTLRGEDELGRPLHTSGRPRNHLAKQASPGYFAWMSMIEWDFAGTAYGQFQDVWSPDRLSRLASSTGQ